MGEHKTEQDIILKLIHSPELTYNELWDKQGESNAFAYHLGKLVDSGIIEKRDDKYRLTPEGRKHSAFIEGDTGEKAVFPTLTIIIVARKGDKVLCQRRLKEPYYGYWGMVSGKINFGLNVEECAARDLEEETGLTAKSFEQRELSQVKTFESGELLHHHFMIVVEAIGVAGELKDTTHKAEHAWLTPIEYQDKQRFPGSSEILGYFGSSQFRIIEKERYMKDGVFIGSKLISERVIG